MKLVLILLFVWLQIIQCMGQRWPWKCPPIDCPPEDQYYKSRYDLCPVCVSCTTVPETTTMITTTDPCPTINCYEGTYYYRPEYGGCPECITGETFTPTTTSTPTTPIMIQCTIPICDECYYIVYPSGMYSCPYCELDETCCNGVPTTTPHPSDDNEHNRKQMRHKQHKRVKFEKKKKHLKRKD